MAAAGNQDWIEALLRETEDPNPDNEIKRIGSLLRAFSDAAPRLVPGGGAGVLRAARDRDPCVEIESLRRYVRDAASSMTPGQMAYIDNSVEVDVMRTVNGMMARMVPAF